MTVFLRTDRLVLREFTESDVDNIDRVWAQTMAVNTRSRRALEKAGLR